MNTRSATAVHCDQAPTISAIGPSTSIAAVRTAQTSEYGRPLDASDAENLGKLNSFRSDKPVPAVEMSYSRSEASRIALAASGRPGMRPEDRTHLARVVAGRTGIAGGTQKSGSTSSSAHPAAL